MNMTRAQVLMMLCVTAAIVFAQVVFQLPRRWTGIQPDLLPCVLLYAGLWGDPILISLLALVGGLLQDSVSANPFGTSVIPLMAVGVAAHAASEILLRDQVHVRCLIGALACAISAGAGLGIIILNGDRPQLGMHAVWVVLGQSFYGALAAPMLFKCLDALDRTFNHPRLPVSSFRPDREIKRGRF